MKTALVLGAGGFIGSHMVKRLRSEGYWVRGVDLKEPEFSETEANEFVYMDLRDPDVMRRVIRYGGERGNFYAQIVDKFLEPFDEIYLIKWFKKLIYNLCIEITSFTTITNDSTHDIWVSQIHVDKFICFCLRELWFF